MHLAVVAMMMLGAHGKAETPEKPPLIVWVGNNGDYKLTVSANGMGAWQQLPDAAHKQVPPPKRSMVKAARLQTLKQMLVLYHVCAFHDTGRDAQPGEVMQKLSLGWDDLQCDVEMLSGDWTKLPNPAQVSRFMNELARDVKSGKAATR